MPHLAHMFVAMLTRNTTDSGTNSRIAFIVKEGSAASDNLHHTFGDTPQDDQERGQANLYDLNVGASSIEPDNLDNNSIRVGIRGSDMWRPENFFAWGRRLFDDAILPLAIETGLSITLSTDAAEGRLSMPLRRVAVGDSTLPINRLLMLMTTSNAANKGTDSPVRLEVTTSGGSTAVDFTIPNTPQREQERGQANWYFVPVNSTLRRTGIRRIRLSILGSDAWLPTSFFLFGLDDAAGRPESIVPLVHVEDWSFGHLSTDSSEGSPFADLPLVAS